MNALNWPKPVRKRSRKAPKAKGGLKRNPLWSRDFRRAGGATLVLGGAIAGLTLYSFGPTDGGKASVTRALPQVAPSNSAVINLPPPDLLRPLSPEEAAQQNADRPFVNRPDTAASRFILKTDAEDRDRALNCLTQAVYYEAAGEGPDGGRAVAQVVLNRMRHPGYPASVCGVVYQGADRTSGCQFTFTCDGSLLRAPIASLWARSRKIAEDALAGKVFAPIGHATHYHADYVLPYWADSLDKTVQIGRHIFYRLRSSLGDSRSFFQHYAGSEPSLPVKDATVVIPPEAVTQELASALISDGIEGASRNVEKAATQPASPLQIDSSHGVLLADAGVTAVAKHQTKQSPVCPTELDRKQLGRLEANDVRAGSGRLGC